MMHMLEKFVLNKNIKSMVRSQTRQLCKRQERRRGSFQSLPTPLRLRLKKKVYPIIKPMHCLMLFTSTYRSKKPL